MKTLYYIFILIIFNNLLLGQNQYQTLVNFARYEKDNLKIKTQNIKPDAVFMGDSITEGWYNLDAQFFTNNNFVGRGISGQTTSQMLLRFRQDVINLKPKKVVILAGTNDIAENMGPIPLNLVFENIISMTELAKAHKIKVILCSVLPAYDFPWRRNLEPANKVITLNEMIKDYAQKNHIPYVDYHTALKDEKNGLSTEMANDGIHPSKKAYILMEQILLKALK